MIATTTFDPDALRKEFADYCADVEPGIKAKAPKLNQLETLALIGMSVFQAAKELKAEKAEQAARIAEVEADRDAMMSALAECRDAMPIPENGAELEGHWLSAMADPLEVPGYVKACMAAPVAQIAVSNGDDHAN